MFSASWTLKCTKTVGNRQLRKRIHVRIEHVRRSRCNEDFLNRVKTNDKLKTEANKKGEKIVCKREALGPRAGFTIKTKAAAIETFTPLIFDPNYF